MTASRKAEVIVVGLGAMGSAASWQLAARGIETIGIDRHHPPHAFGSSHGDTRITRLAVGEGAEYVPLVRRSHELWREIETQTGVRLLTQTGGLVLAHPTTPFAENTRAVAKSEGVEHELLSNAELRRRFPMFAVDEETEAYYEPAAGYVRPEAAIRALLHLARSSGAELRPGERVERWTATPGGGVTVTTDAATYAAERLVLCAGPWIQQLFPEGRGLFAVHRQLMYWFEIREHHDQLARMPIFVWELGGEQADFVHLRGFYGFPALDGPTGGLKVATESYRATTTPDDPQPAATAGERAAMYRDFVEPALPWLGPDTTKTVACLYTCTRESRFVIDSHPEHDAVLIVSPCSGHGFKHSPAIGEAVVDWVTGATPATGQDPTAFALARQAPGVDGKPREPLSGPN